MIVVALAGRRIDAPNAEKPRFPSENTEKVRKCISDLLMKHNAATLVCSAACGADLIALDAAGKLGLRRRIILPFERGRFREMSVTDRPGDWGVMFDRIYDEVQAAGDLVILNKSEQDETAFIATNEAIINEALSFACSSAKEQKANNKISEGKLLAVIVWDGIPRNEGATDMTEAFMLEARKHGFAIAEITTL
ncbi:hypothetical protein CAL7716_049280 [Calothrix sp. PCC 7716]|nr:hypothetical protein CAL7716_049280 [Calothrix sp. PCC 7716]